MSQAAEATAAIDPERGLDPAEAEERLARFGPNELPPPPRDLWVSRLLRQLREPMALLLVAAAAVAGFGLGERIDATAILAIVALNAAIGVIQEGRAARALEALRTMETPMARVVRGGLTMVIPSKEVVPGDALMLAAGDRVPADARLLAAAALELDESLLTGESLPVGKTARASHDPAAPLAEQRSMVFSGTLITRGSGAGVVVATGPATQLGRIAAHLRDREPLTPLQLELARLTTRLGAISVVIAAGVFGLTLVRTGLGEESLQRAFLASVALAVAAVPEGLATVVTVALALGVRRMATEGAIVRRLPAVETLGSTTVIATDKTGTLTENRLRLEAVALPGSPPASLPDLPDAVRDGVIEVAVLCNDAVPDPPSGDPLDVALLEVVSPSEALALRRRFPRVAGIPFESERQRMTALHEAPGGLVLLVKGAPEIVVARCAETITREGPRLLGPSDRDALLAEAAEMARRGIRVLALARRDLSPPTGELEDAETELTLVGLAGLRDPVRAEAAAAVSEAASAGVTLLMVTGDHPGTAAAIAQETGLAPAGTRPLTGAELRAGGMPEDPTATRVYARVDPEQKLALVEALRDRGHIVAVTGDGVNDAPALRRADIGVAMGRSGSEVAREAADMVITDDNLATIVTAVREGRSIYANIRKVVDYLIAGNLSEITVVVSSLLLFPGLGVPLLPLQLLWINLLTDGLPALALGVDPVDPAVMHQPPRRRSERLLGGRRTGLLFARGVVIAAAAVSSLAVARFVWNEPWAHARAVMFTVLMVAHLLYAFAVRRPTPGTPANRWLIGAVLLGIVLQVIVVAWPAAHDLFGTARLSPSEWGLVAVAGVLPAALIAALPGLRSGR